MKIAPFALERYYARYEFSARYMLSSSDCESLSMSELLALASPETLSLWQNLKLGYTETPGHPLLRKAIADSYQGITPDGVLVMAPEEGIFLALHALLEAGDHVICTVPAYQSLYEVARSIGCEVTSWQPHEEQGWRFDLSELERMIRNNTKLLVVNFPHNPTGYIPTTEEYDELVALTQRRQIYLFSDEMYRCLEIDPYNRLPPACVLSPGAVSLSGLSKAFGLPGLRIGWIATRDRTLLEKIIILKDYTTICSSAPSEILALIALQNAETILSRQLARIRANLAVLDRFFDQHHSLFRCNRPLGGSICFLRLLGVDDTLAFCEKLVQDTGIMLVPSAMFQFGNHHVRIGFGRQNLPEVLELFAEYLNERDS